MSYLERTVANLEEHCERRGIPVEEMGSIRAAIIDKFGKSLEEMEERELLKFNRVVYDLLFEYLGNKKRRLGPAPSFAAEGEGSTFTEGG